MRQIPPVLMEQNDEWTESRRYMGPDIVAKVSTGLADHDATIQEVNIIETISA